MILIKKLNYTSFVYRDRKAREKWCVKKREKKTWPKEKELMIAIYNI